MVDRIPRSQIQLHTLQAAKAQLDHRGAGDFTAIPAADRAAFVQSVQQAVPDMPSAAVQDVLQAEWAKGMESLLSNLRSSQLQGIFDKATSAGAAAGQPRPNGTNSPLGVRLQQAASPAAPFWHQSTAEGPY